MRIVPWTRVLAAGPCLDPDGRRAPDLVALVSADPDRYVLKRSWDYGGKSVLLGRDIVATEGHGVWRAKVVEALAEGPGAYVAQELVVSPRKRHLVVGQDGATTWEDVFVDASSYSATGDTAVPGGGVARFARVGVVNIVGGGGVAPLILTSVANRLATGLARHLGA